LQVFDPIRQGRAFGKSKSLAKLAGQKGAGEVTEALQSFVGDPSEPLLEELLTEAQWKKICSAGGLNDSCVPQVYAAIVRYRQQRTATQLARRNVSQARDAISKAKDLIVDQLCKDQEFLRVGTNLYEDVEINWPVIADWIEKSQALIEELNKTDERFDAAPQSLLFPQSGALEELVYGVLSVQATFQGRAPPTYHQESSGNPQFVEYVTLCAQVADSESHAADPDKFAKQVKAALIRATNSLKFVRDSDREGWAANWETDP
jgi:hypothetical protein